MQKKSFIFLMSANKETAHVAKTVMAKIKEKIDATAAPLWIDSHGLGVFISTDLPAWKIWNIACPEELRDGPLLQGFMVIEIGPDWHTKHGDKASGWLNSRYPKT
jgi:hypothetical protein